MAEQRIEEIINDTLMGDTQTNALDFIAFLRAEDIAYNQSGGYLDVHCLGRNVCSVLITGDKDAPGPWTIWSEQEPGTWVTWPDGEPGGGQAGLPEDAHTREIAWAHVNPCASCGGDCSPGRRKTVFGRGFDNLCNSALAFTDPDAEALACAKRMVQARVKDIRESTQTL